MGKVDEYRKRARECVELAKKHKPADRPRLLSTAQAWLTLADRAEKEEGALREIGKFPPMSSDTGHQAASGSIPSQSAAANNARNHVADLDGHQLAFGMRSGSSS